MNQESPQPDQKLRHTATDLTLIGDEKVKNFKLQDLWIKGETDDDDNEVKEYLDA